jgi:hypothetical protein
MNTVFHAVFDVTWKKLIAPLSFVKGSCERIIGFSDACVGSRKRSTLPSDVGTEMHLTVKQWFCGGLDIKRHFAICLALSVACWHPVAS